LAIGAEVKEYACTSTSLFAALISARTAALAPPFGVGEEGVSCRFG